MLFTATGRRGGRPGGWEKGVDTRERERLFKNVNFYSGSVNLSESWTAASWKSKI